MKWNRDVSSAPRNTGLLLLVQEAVREVCGFGSIEVIRGGERVNFGYVETATIYGPPGVVTCHGKKVAEVVGWSDYPTSTSPKTESSELEIADRRIIHLEEALTRIRDTAEIAAEYGHFDMLVSTLQSLSEDAQQALKVTE